MKMSNAELVGFFAALAGLRTRGMPAKLAWKLCVSEKVLKPFGDAFDASAEELRKRYADKDENDQPIVEETEDGRVYKIPKDKLEEANKELKELLAEQFDVSPVELSLADFPESFQVTPETMALLAPLMEMTQQDKKKK